LATSLRVVGDDVPSQLTHRVEDTSAPQ